MCNSEKQREAARQHMIDRNKSEKARKTSSLMGKEKFVKYNKSKKHREDVKGNTNWKKCFFTEKSMKARKNNMVRYNKSALGRMNSSKSGKIQIANLLAYNNSERGRKQHKEILTKYMNELGGKELARQRAVNGKNTKIKYYFSKKNDRTLYYHSTWELASFKILEQLNIIKSYDRCRFFIPYELEGKTKNYIPDIIVTYQDDSQEVIEIKPNCFVNHPINLAKIESLKKYCNERGLKLGIWTENYIFAKA
jgi:hypothetical protein